jgi:hypothetical protein
MIKVIYRRWRRPPGDAQDPFPGGIGTPEMAHREGAGHPQTTKWWSTKDCDAFERMNESQQRAYVKLKYGYDLIGVEIIPHHD